MAAPGVRSFRKAVKKDVNKIQGTKPSPQNFALLTSCGLQALDTILGGGLPVGSLVLIEEDQYGQYAEVFAKYFISEGILCDQKIFVGALDFNCSELLSTLPGPAEEAPVKQNEETSNDKEDMTIAWRYKNMKVADTTIDGKNSFGHKLHLNSPLDSSVVEAAELRQWPTQDPEPDISSQALLSEIGKELENEKHKVGDGKTKRQVLRVALLGLGSAQWEASTIAPMLYQLRSWLRQSVAVGLITVPSHLYKDKSEVVKWIHFADVCIRLEAFAGTARATNPALKDYHGLFHVVKLPAFNSLVPHIPPSDLAFKLRRRRLVIERLCLPPELEDTSARSENEGSVTGCGTARSVNLEF